MTDAAGSQSTSTERSEVAAVPSAPDQAREVFGSRLALSEAYANRLAVDGVAHGHIGPREVPRLWLRHLVNSALVSELIPTNAAVLDVGSGAGLPGLPVAIRRSDVRVTLLEPMLRRTEFLSSCVRELSLENQVTVFRGRAEDPAVVEALGGQHLVLARAVAPLDRLVKWCLPLLSPGGILLAMKGSSAMDELAEHRATIERLGAEDIQVARLGGFSDDATWVVSVRRRRSIDTQRKVRRR